MPSRATGRSVAAGSPSGACPAAIPGAAAGGTRYPPLLAIRAHWPTRNVTHVRP